jgi:exodeoxyribonuclease VII large subunit
MKGNCRGGPNEEAPRDLYTVTEITEAIKQHLESEFPAVSVIGEVANFKKHSSGHVYLTLRDGSATIHAVVFRRYAETLSFVPENGMLAIASGRISHFGGSGQTQILATDLIPAGHGSMELEFRGLLRCLRDEGLTAPERKRPIPPFPRLIAVITSPTGAVIRDILDTLARRWPVAGVLHVCAEVQGPAAASSVVRAFGIVNGMEEVDIVILARGGGSVEDLWTFNREEVARAVAFSRHPVITGIGHEIDTTIVDYVSDLRAATPTAAAELATPLIDDVRRTVAAASRRLATLCRSSLEARLHLVRYLVRSSAFPALIHRMERAELEIDDRVEWLSEWRQEWVRETAGFIDGFDVQMRGALVRFLETAERHLAAQMERLKDRSPAGTVERSRAAIGYGERMMRAHVLAAHASRRRELAGSVRALAELDPRGVLRRGYSFCTSGDGGRIVPRAKELSVGDEMMVHFYDGGTLCTVREKRRGTPWRRK